MNKIEDSSIVMMSDVLRDNVSEVDNEVEQFSDRFIVVTLFVDTGESIQPPAQQALQLRRPYLCLGSERLTQLLTILVHQQA